MISDVKKNPTYFMVFSLGSSFKISQKTQPEFSLVKEASKLIEESVKEIPDLGAF